MSKKVLTNLKDIKDKVVLVRVDFNVPFKDKVVSDDNRIVEALPTIKFLQDQGAKVVLLSHLGKVNHKEESKELEDKRKNDMQLVVAAASKHIEGLKYCASTRGKELEKAISELKAKEVLLVQNTRYEKGEEKNDTELASYWANLGVAFVMDAFGSAHRAHASTYGIADVMNKNNKPAVLGKLVEKEVQALSKSVEAKGHPYVAVLGGSKVSDKIKVIEKLLDKADSIIIGGAMAYTFLKAKGFKVGDSLVEDDQLEFAKECLKKGGKKIILPIDHVIAKTINDQASVRNTLSENIIDGFKGLDIGMRTISLYQKILKEAKIIFWNGPMGVFEKSWLEKGTISVCKVIADNTNAFSVVGGGDSAAAVAQFGYKDKFSHVSTGGGASLEMIEKDGHLPCLDVILEA